jgi:hypothetical protein
MTQQVQSKKQLAATVYAAMTAGDVVVKRKDVIAAMVAKAGLSPAGASTYFHNFRTGLWVIAAAPAVEAQAAVEAVVTEEAAVDVVVVAEVQHEEAPAVAEVILPDNYAEMSKAELVALYNSKAEKQVKDFRDHATAVRRVTALFAPAV